MPAMTFVDTNVLLYAICPGEHDRTKAETAREILRGSGASPPGSRTGGPPVRPALRYASNSFTTFASSTPVSFWSRP
jgi:hypothetical protein